MTADHRTAKTNKKLMKHMTYSKGKQDRNTADVQELSGDGSVVELMFWTRHALIVTALAPATNSTRYAALAPPARMSSRYIPVCRELTDKRLPTWHYKAQVWLDGIGPQVAS